MCFLFINIIVSYFDYLYLLYCLPLCCDVVDIPKRSRVQGSISIQSSPIFSQSNSSSFISHWSFSIHSVLFGLQSPSKHSVFLLCFDLSVFPLPSVLFSFALFSSPFIFSVFSSKIAPSLANMTVSAFKQTYHAVLHQHACCITCCLPCCWTHQSLSVLLLSPALSFSFRYFFTSTMFYRSSSGNWLSFAFLLGVKDKVRAQAAQFRAKDWLIFSQFF